MSSKLLFLVIALLISAGSTQAASFDHVQLSPSFAVEIPGELHAQMGFMGSYGGFWLEGKENSRKVSIWIQREKAPTMANPFSVKRFWKEGLSQAGMMGEISQDKGCRSLSKYVFQCERRSKAKKERFAAETLIWNAQSDLVVVRVMSDDSYETAENVAKMLQFKPLARLPAGQRALRAKGRR